MIPYVLVVVGVIAANAAHARFLSHTPQVVPAWFAGAWLAHSVGTPLALVGTLLGLSPWVAAACALLGAGVGVLGMPRLVERATEAEHGRRVYHATWRRRAAPSQAARDLDAWLDSQSHHRTPEA